MSRSILWILISFVYLLPPALGDQISLNQAAHYFYGTTREAFSLIEHEYSDNIDRVSRVHHHESDQRPYLVAIISNRNGLIPELTFQKTKLRVALENLLSSHPKIQVVETCNFDDLLRETDREGSLLFDPTTTPQHGRFFGAEYLVILEHIISKSEIAFYIKVVDLSTRAVISVSEMRSFTHDFSEEVFHMSSDLFVPYTEEIQSTLNIETDDTPSDASEAIPFTEITDDGRQYLSESFFDYYFRRGDFNDAEAHLISITFERLNRLFQAAGFSRPFRFRGLHEDPFSTYGNVAMYDRINEDLRSVIYKLSDLETRDEFYRRAANYEKNNDILYPGSALFTMTFDMVVDSSITHSPQHFNPPIRLDHSMHQTTPCLCHVIPKTVFEILKMEKIPSKDSEEETGEHRHFTFFNDFYSSPMRLHELSRFLSQNIMIVKRIPVELFYENNQFYLYKTHGGVFLQFKLAFMNQYAGHQKQAVIRVYEKQYWMNTDALWPDIEWKRWSRPPETRLLNDKKNDYILFSVNEGRDPAFYSSFTHLALGREVVVSQSLPASVYEKSHTVDIYLYIKDKSSLDEGDLIGTYLNITIPQIGRFEE